MEHTRHLWRMAALLILLFVLVIVGRHFAVPESFGAHGFYRYDALGEIMAIPAVHGDGESCRECHDGVAGAKAAGRHRGLSCESCHAPLATHVHDGDAAAPMAIDRSVTLCTRCHLPLPARPEFVPVVIPREHLELEEGQAIPEGACLECHDPHDPQT